MKLLQTEQQSDLQELFEALKLEPGFGNLAIGLQNDITYWALELKPKRLRRLPKDEE